MFVCIMLHERMTKFLRQLINSENLKFFKFFENCKGKKYFYFDNNQCFSKASISNNYNLSDTKSNDILCVIKFFR